MTDDKYEPEFVSVYKENANPCTLRSILVVGCVSASLTHQVRSSPVMKPNRI